MQCNIKITKESSLLWFGHNVILHNVMIEEQTYKKSVTLAFTFKDTGTAQTMSRQGVDIISLKSCGRHLKC